MRNNKEEGKMFTVRIAYETWVFLKKAAIDQEMSMQKIVGKCLEKYKKSMEKKIT